MSEFHLCRTSASNLSDVCCRGKPQTPESLNPRLLNSKALHPKSCCKSHRKAQFQTTMTLSGNVIGTLRVRAIQEAHNLENYEYRPSSNSRFYTLQPSSLVAVAAFRAMVGKKCSQKRHHPTSQLPAPRWNSVLS